MVDDPNQARNTDVIAGRDDKGKPLTQEQVDERTEKKLEADKKSSEEVKEQLKSEKEEAEKATEAQAKADEEFKKKQEKAAEKEQAKAPDHPAPQGRAAHR